MLGLSRGAAVAEFPGEGWDSAHPAEVHLSEARLQQAREYALKGGGSGIIVRHGKVVMTWGDQARLYDLKSTAKSIGVTVLGLALQDGKVRLDDKAVQYHPELGATPATNKATGWIEQITLRHLANQTAGFEKPGGYGRLLFAPGTKWHYSDAGPNWLAECLTLVYGRDLDEVMFERVFTPIGIKRTDLRWREHSYRPKEINGMKRREFGSGFHANVRAMARIGYLYSHDGRWGDRQIIPADFVRLARGPSREVRGLAEHEDGHGDASEHYSLLWWNNGDGTLAGVPRDAFWSWGLYEGIIVVIPSLDLVIARAGQEWGPRNRPRRTSAEHYSVLKPFLEPIVQAARAGRGGHGSAIKPSGPPYPPSPVITEISWAPKAEIIRHAKGSDTWPSTWGDDDALYSAYGDGNGFVPFVPQKLSLGIVKVLGNPPHLEGVNIRSASGEFLGDGRAGRKASGMLMVGGTLYILTRNVGNAQLGWSEDHGVTWTWAGWRFTAGFGAPTFLNFGRNYAGARDGFVYVYSHDHDSAYEAADRMVMARVPKDRIRDEGAYEYFVRLGADGQPGWSRDIAQRGAVFTHRGNCYRNGITYNAALGRYLWCQVLPHSTHAQGMRFQGGFGIYDAPEPWGPWTTVFFTEAWDVGPGETNSLPTKWMSADGRTVHLLSSTDDHFSVRRATLAARPKR